MVPPLWKLAWSFLKKLPIDPAHHTVVALGIYPQGTKTRIRWDPCTRMFIAALSTRAKLWQQPKCPSTGECIKDRWCVRTMENYSAVTENEISPLAKTWMELETTTLSDRRQREKDKCRMISLISGI